VTQADPTARSRPDSLESTGSFLTAADGTSIWLSDARAAGEPVLFLHGFSGSSSAAEHLVPHLAAAGFRPVVYDQRGHGFSQKPTCADSYEMARFVDDAARVLDECGIDRAHVVGHCLGGMVATAMALAHPDRVQSLVLVGTSMRPSADQRFVAWTERKARRLLRAPLRHVFPAEAPVDRHVEYARFRKTGDWYWRRMVADYRALSADTMLSIVETLDTLDLLDDAGRVTAPTLVVHGARDTVFPIAAAHRTTAAIPGSDLVILPNDNHVTLVLQHDSVLFDTVAEHARAHPAGPRARAADAGALA
jgi:pimeloyl-ACP methyl ester carboxylesterase